MSGRKYKIALQEVTLDGETFVEATVKEFPDVAVYEESADQAYAVALETVESLIEMAEEMGHQVPMPSARENEEFSGKMTFRPGRRLHREIAAAADADGLSQNQWLCNVVAQAVTLNRAKNQLREVAANAFENMKAASFSTWRTILESKQTRAASFDYEQMIRQLHDWSSEDEREKRYQIVLAGEPFAGHAYGEISHSATGAATSIERPESAVKVQHLIQARSGARR